MEEKQIMKKTIENRLKELYVEHKHLTQPYIVWIKEKGGLTKEERVKKCEILINELENLLPSVPSIYDKIG
jgi:hypothetical protein